MKIAELFAELGFQIKGADELKAFETSLNNIASAAERAAAALKQLAGQKMPEGLKSIRIVQQTSTGAVKVPPIAAPPKIAGGAFEDSSGDMASIFSRGLKPLMKIFGIAGLVSVLADLVSSLKRLAIDSAKAQFEMNQFTKQTGMTRDEMKQWEFIAAKGGISAEELQKQFISLQDIGQQIRFGQRMPASPALGIVQTQAPDVVLKEFARATQNMDMATARMFAESHGIDPRMVFVLREYLDQLGRTSKSALLQPGQVEDVNKMNQAWIELGFTIKLLSDKLVAEFAPALWELFNIINQILNTTGVARNIARYSLTLGAPMSAASLFGRDMISAASRMGGSQTTNNQTTATIHVDGAQNPTATAQAIKRELSDAFSQRWQPMTTSLLFAQP